MKTIILISLLLSLLSCQKSIEAGETAALCPVEFYTSYKPIENVPVFINGAFLTKLPYFDSEPECGYAVCDLFWAAPNRYYKVRYAGNDLDPTMTIDTTFIVKENTCTVINLDN